jgi:SAM-dependent methyltransferase
MELTSLIARMRCPSCGGTDLTREDDAARCSKCGHGLPVQGDTVNASGRTQLSAEWEEMQAGSVERYQDEHYEEDETFARIFGGFMAVTISPSDRILDVGCGLFPHLPAYVDQLRFGEYVGLEPLTTPVERSYTCVTGAVAEDLPFQDASFDAHILATSLDHIMDVDRAIGELRRVLAPGGRFYFWVGLADPDIIARAKSFHPIFYGQRGVKRAARIAAAYAEYGYFMYRMWSRRRKLERGIPLDHAHCRYYTRHSLFADMEKWNLDVRRSLLIPGSNGVLVEAVPR